MSDRKIPTVYWAKWDGGPWLPTTAFLACGGHAYGIKPSGCAARITDARWTWGDRVEVPDDFDGVGQPWGKAKPRVALLPKDDATRQKIIAAWFGEPCEGNDIGDFWRESGRAIDAANAMLESSGGDELQRLTKVEDVLIRHAQAWADYDALGGGAGPPSAERLDASGRIESTAYELRLLGRELLRDPKIESTVNDEIRS